MKYGRVYFTYLFVPDFINKQLFKYNSAISKIIFYLYNIIS